MNTIIPINSQTDPLWHRWISLYEEAFPPNERLPEAHLQKRIIQKNNFCMAAITREKLFVGLLGYWQFTEMNYLEHIAILPQHRGKNIGGEILEELQIEKTKPWVLEVEPPTDEITQKRIEFYKRHHFILYPDTYWQPPYTPQQQKVELKIMANTPRTEIFYQKIIQNLYTQVYNTEFPINLP